MSLADGESEDNEDCHGAELCPGGHVGEERAPAQSEDVDASEGCDQYESYRVRARERHSCQRKNHMLLRYEGNDVPHVSRGSDGERRDAAAIPYREQHPAVEKRDQIAVSFA